MKLNLAARLNGLREVVPRLSGKDREFAESLLRQASTRGLSPRQEPWIEALRDRALNPQEDRRQQLGPEFKGVVELLDRAAQNLKWPRLLFRANGVDYRLTIAGELARIPGAINVTSAKKGDDGSRPWFGRVTREGEFEPSRSLDDATATAMTAALKALSADPAGAAKVYGLATGACCFCGLELTDKRSIDAGYGPICADKWGLPWGL